MAPRGRLDDVDLSLRLSGEEAARRLFAAQRRMLTLRLQLAGLIGDRRLGPPLLVLFEGWDASGKGGAIKRLVAPLDPRHVRVVKLWLVISAEEQLKRFKKREQDPLRRWKLTDEDWLNRGQRPQYEQAVEAMLERTDQPAAPWRLIPAESKGYARVAVIETVVDAVENGMRAHGIEPLPTL